MSKYYYDFHIHSCLSPCGDDDMTPANIAGASTLAGLNIVALTDHNTTKNCKAFLESAKQYGIIGVAGMELTTAEDIHMVCLFQTSDLWEIPLFWHSIPPFFLIILSFPYLCGSSSTVGAFRCFSFLQKKQTEVLPHASSPS